MIKISHLVKNYGNFTAVDDISFEVAKGEVLGFLGPNGAGKSTTMNMLTGYLSSTSGSIKIGGVDVLDDPLNAKRLIGYLPEQPPVYGEMTPREYLMFVAEAKGVPFEKSLRHVKEVMQLTQIYDVRNRLIRNLSKGYRQRVGLADALLGDPDLLILDEPTNGLDPMGMVAVRELLRSLCVEDGITILISSHILAELYQLVTDYIIISQGQIVETLSKAELDERCTAFLLLETDEPTKAAQVLRAGGVRQLVQEGHTLRLFDAPSAESLARQLFDARILVTALEKHETTLEEYYMKLLGRAVQ